MTKPTVTEKPCTMCKRMLSADNFGRVKTNLSGLHSWCFECRREKARAYIKRPGVRQRMLEYHRAWDSTPKRKAQRRRRRLQRQFGITIERADEMRANQQGLCAICLNPEVLNQDLSVDHCHKTGKVRALLCHRCNWVLGAVEESRSILQEMVSYLDQHAGDGIKEAA